MAVTDVSLCSNALLRLGAKAISSFTDGTPRATLCSGIYPTVKNDILSRYDWNFTKTKAQLSRLTEAPLNVWSYKFTLPGDRLTDGPMAVYNSSAVGALPIKDFEIFSDGLYADDTEIYIDYTKDSTSESNWPVYFQNFVIAALMAELAYPITDQANLAKLLDEKAWGTVAEGRSGGLFAATKARNAKEDPPIVFQDFTLVDARFGGS